MRVCAYACLSSPLARDSNPTILCSQGVAPPDIITDAAIRTVSAAPPDSLQQLAATPGVGAAHAPALWAALQEAVTASKGGTQVTGTARTRPTSRPTTAPAKAPRRALSFVGCPRPDRPRKRASAAAGGHRGNRLVRRRSAAAATHSVGDSAAAGDSTVQEPSGATNAAGLADSIVARAQPAADTRAVGPSTVGASAARELDAAPNAAHTMANSTVRGSTAEEPIASGAAGAVGLADSIVALVQPAGANGVPRDAVVRLASAQCPGAGASAVQAALRELQEDMRVFDVQGRLVAV